MENSFQFEDFLDPQKLADIIARDKDELAIRIKKKVKERLLATSPSTCISFDLYSEATLVQQVNFKATKEFARVLIAFMREKEFEGKRVESQVTPIALNAAEEAITEFYSDEKLQTLISKELTNQIEENKIIQAALKADLSKDKEWLVHELNTIIAGNTAHSLAGQSIDALARSLSHFFQSEVGKSILLSMGKIMSTQMGHMLMRYIALSVSKTLTSTAFRTAIVTTIKKIGIGVLIKTVVGKSVIALLALVGISGIPAMWVVLPLITGLLIYEYNHFPKKLANKLPEDIASGIVNNFHDLNLSVSKNIVSAVAKEFVNEITKVRKA